MSNPMQWTRALALAMGMLVAATGAGCSSKKAADPKGSAVVSVSGNAIQMTDAVTLQLTISDNGQLPTFANIVRQMSKKNDGTWTGFVADIPAGVRKFHVDAFDATSNVIFTGETTAPVLVGQKADVYLMLQQVAPPNNFGNHAPVIDVLTASSSSVAPGGMVSLHIAATDPDTATAPDNKIAGYQWAIQGTGCGSLTNPNTPDAVWTAPNPSADTTCVITVTVSDVCGASLANPDQSAACSSSVTAYMQLKVVNPQTGNASVNAYPNTCPVITCVSSVQDFTYDANHAVNGYVANLTVNAVDHDSDDLHYSWSSSCGGATFNPAGEIVNAPNTVAFTSNTVAACSARVDVTDYWPNNTPPAGSGLPAARGCVNVGIVNMGAAKDFALFPKIANASGPNPTNQITAGQPARFGADISDPNGQPVNSYNGYPLTIEWFNDTAGQAATDGFGAKSPSSGTLSAAGPIWAEFTPPAIVPNMKIRLRVTNVYGDHSEQVFNLIPANTCSLPNSDGNACDDGNPCTQTDTCQAGVCVGSNPKDCSASGTTCNPATCDVNTGACVQHAASAGTTCNDSNACTTNDLCDGLGACLGGLPPACPGVDQCHAAACVPATGCQPAVVTAGVTCNDSNACTTGETCQADGTCGGGTAKVCNSPTTPACQAATGTCNPADGSCSYAAANTGGACVTNLCKVGQVCKGDGTCDPGTDKVCQTGYVCDSGTGNCTPPVFYGPKSAAQLDSNALARKIAVDGSGNVVVAGSLWASVSVGGSAPLPYSGGADVLVAKLDPNAWTSFWAKGFGEPIVAPAANTNQSANGVAVSSVGTVGLIGTFEGSVTIGSPLTVSSGTNEFMAALNASGTAQWAKQFNLGTGNLMAIAGNPNADSFAICGTADLAATSLVASAHRCTGVYATDSLDPLCATTPSTCTAATGICDPAKDIVVALVRASDGNVLWSRQIGGVGSQYCTALAFDDMGDLLIGGSYNGGLDLGTGAFGFVSSTTRSQLFAAKLSGTTGATLLAAAYPNAAAGNQAVNSIAADGNGDVFIGGSMQRQVNFSATIQLVANGTTGSDAFVAKLSKTDLSALWARRWGGTANDQVASVAIDSIGEVYAVGDFNGVADVGPTSCANGTTGCAGVTTVTSAGAADLLVVRLDGATGDTTGSARYGDASSQSALGAVINRHVVGSELDSLLVIGTFQGNLDLGISGQSPLSAGTLSTPFLVKEK